MRLDGIDGTAIELHPVGYQFPELDIGFWYDRNWLLIEGRVETVEGAWSFVDPCLLTTEAARLGSWLTDAADGAIPPVEPDQDGNVWPSLDFLEPNLGFGVKDHEAGDVVIRVHFSLESAPPWEAEEQRSASGQYFVTCWLSQDSLRRAAEEWTASLTGFPKRGEPGD